MSDTTTIGLSRRVVSVAAAAGLALAGTVTLASGSQGATEEPKKVYVCKYVGTPGEDERLQTGDNPIQVSVNAIPGPGPVEVGYEFADAQGRSLVIAFVEDKKAEPEPECPPPTPPTTTTTPPTMTTPPETTTPPQTTTTPPETTTPPTMTTTVTPPPKTTTVTPPPETKTVTPPPVTHAPPPAAGGGVPGAGAPDTGGDGGTNPLNTLLGSGLLLSAGGLLTWEMLRRRREVDAS